VLKLVTAQYLLYSLKYMIARVFENNVNKQNIESYFNKTIFFLLFIELFWSIGIRSQVVGKPRANYCCKYDLRIIFIDSDVRILIIAQKFYEGSISV
jgi:hypothetical protein